MKKLESLRNSKFYTLEKNFMSKLYGGVGQDECTGAGTRTVDDGHGNVVTYTWSSDCLNIGGTGANGYYPEGHPSDGC